MGASVVARRPLLQCLTLACVGTILRGASAMGRLPLGGRFSVRIPYETSRLDPHDLSDPLAALIGPAVFDTVYSLDSSGNPYPSLADGMPRRDGRLTRVALRDGLRSSRGHAIDARDLISSLQRARSMGAAALLADLPAGSVDKADARIAVFRDVDPLALAQMLASPLAAFASRRSTPAAPDGTGAFRVSLGSDRLTLARNPLAARGPSLLEEVAVLRASDIADSLRAFEAQATEMGWLGAGLHQPRPGSVPFDLGAVAWIVLRTGNEAGEWGAPGVAQRLADAIPPNRLAHLALGRIPAPAGTPSWGGSVCDLLVEGGSAHLVEVARSVASILSAPGHEVTAMSVPSTDLRARRKAGTYSLMLDVVRPVGPPGIATLIALSTADQGAQARSVVRHPPRLASFAPRALTRTLRLGVIGELRVTGASVSSLRLAQARDGNGWDLGTSYRLATS